MSRPSKLVIPVAGLGSRFLPATKAVPKELLPIIDKPIIHFIVEEAVEAGFETIVLVTSRPKVSIEDYFDPADLVAHRLAEKGKEAQIADVLDLSSKIDIVSIRQYDPKGLGHAVLTAEPVVGGQSFAVVLGDDIIKSSEKASAIGQCLKSFLEKGSHVIGTLEVEETERHKYGIVEADPATQKISRFVEKPSSGETNSCLAIPGRYVFLPSILEALKETPLGKGSELQLTDAMDLLLRREIFYSQKINGERFDTGDKLGYIKANVSFALNDPEHKEHLYAWLKEKITKV